jgi:hypothetical protein
MSKYKKGFTRLASEYHTFFEGFKVPVGALYGRCLDGKNELFWACTNYSGITTRQPLTIHIMKREWACNSKVEKQRYYWNTQKIGVAHIVYTTILDFLRKECGGKIPKVKTYIDPYYMSLYKKINSVRKARNAERRMMLKNGVLPVMRKTYLDSNTAKSGYCHATKPMTVADEKGDALRNELQYNITNKDENRRYVVCINDATPRYGFVSNDIMARTRKQSAMVSAVKA